MPSKIITLSLNLSVDELTCDITFERDKYFRLDIKLFRPVDNNSSQRQDPLAIWTPPVIPP